MVRFWPVCLVVAVACTLAAIAFAAQRPTTYTAEARCAVGGSDLAAQAIPGFALASQEVASNYARFVSTAPVVALLPAAERGAVRSVTASPIPSSNVVRIEAKASTSAAARDAARTAASSLVSQVSDAVDAARPADTLADYNAISAKVAAAASTRDLLLARVTALEGRLAPAAEATSTPLVRLRSQLAQANATLAGLTLQQSALGNRYQGEVNAAPSQSRLSVVQTATLSGDDRTSRIERFGVLGLAVGLALALALAVLLERRSHQGATRERVAVPEQADVRTTTPAGRALRR